MEDRRKFLRMAAMASGAIALGTSQQSCNSRNSKPDTKAVIEKPQSLYKIPAHLPAKLTISLWHWGYVIGSGEGEPYENLEKTCEGLVERGFNTVRIDTMLNCCFNNDSSLRSEVPFQQFIHGYSNRLRDMNYRGGIRRNVLDKIIELMLYAKKYNFYVILSEWEYMHTYWFYANKSITESLFVIPPEKRVMNIALKFDRLISILKEKDLAANIAYIDVINEPPYSDIAKENLKINLAESISFLKSKHPDIYFTVSEPYSPNDPKGIQFGIPDNIEIYDQHPYTADGLYWREVWNKTIMDKNFDKNNPQKNPLMKRLLEEKLIDYNDFMIKAPAHAPEFWLKICWFFSNVDSSMYDRFVIDLYKRTEQEWKENAEKIYAKIADEAALRKLPVSITEGGFWSSPLNSRFEESEYGLSYFDHLTNCAIKNDFWGFMQNTYNGAGCPMWWTNSKWLFENNQRFINSKIK